MLDSSDPRVRVIARLYGRLIARRTRLNLLDSYLTNEVAVPTLATRSVRESYSRLVRMSRMNYAELVVEATRERMTPVGFRTGADGDATGDKEAWRIWQANSLDADQAVVHGTMLGLGEAYVIVGEVDDDIGAPLISVEDPRDVIAQVDPITRRRSTEAIKLFRDYDEGVDRLYLYLPGEVHRATATFRDDDPLSAEFDAARWNWNGDAQALPSRVVPVVRFANKVRTRSVSMAEFEGHLPLLDRINYQIMQRLTIATLQAFRQRAVIGVPDRDEEGNLVDYGDVFASAPDALWTLPAGASMWESGQVDLSAVRLAVRDDVQDLAAVTRTPLYYLTPDATNGSAEGASLAREGLVFKVTDRIGQASESWEQVMSIAFTMAGDGQRASRQDMEVLWSPPERYSLAERVDAANKAGAAGVPWRAVMQHILQFSPQEIDRMAADRVTDAFLNHTPQTNEDTLLANGMTVRELKTATEALALLIAQGADPNAAARELGLSNIPFPTRPAPTAAS